VVFLDRLLQTAFFDFFFLAAAEVACCEPAERVAASADAKPAVGVTSRASRQAQTRLYALGDIRRAPFLQLGIWCWSLAGGRPPT
jgi:hypothetical protein